MKAVVFTDIHCFASYQLMDYPTLYTTMAKVPMGTLLVDLEDNIDLRNCRKLDVGMARKALYEVKDLVERKDGVFVLGNHNLNLIGGDIFKVIQGDKKKVLFTHGHFLFWSPVKIEAFVNQEAGCGPLKRLLYNSVTDGVFHFFHRSLSQDFFDRLEYYAKLYDVTDVYCGHKHCLETITGTYKGINYTVFSRGVHEIEI